MKIHKTKQLFYRKYPYRVEMKCHGVDLLMKYGETASKEFCIKPGNADWRWRSFTESQKLQLLEFIDNIDDYFKRGLKIRSEYNTLSFYLDNHESYLEIRNHFENWVNSVTEPGSGTDLEKLLSKNHIMLCNTLPHGIYGFKVKLKYAAVPHGKRESLLKWLDGYGEVYLLTDSTRNWLMNKGYSYDPYIYVKTSQQLLLLQLFCGNAIKTTYEYVLRDTAINTVSEDETCQP